MECAPHTLEHLPNKAYIRKLLGELTTDITCVIKESDARPIEVVEAMRHEYSVDEESPGFQRALQSPSFAHAKGRFNTYVSALTTSEYSKPSLEEPYIPVGEYGEEAAKRLLIGLARAIDITQ